MLESQNNSKSTRNAPAIYGNQMAKKSNKQYSFFSIHPNPATNNLTLFNPSLSNEEIQLSIFSNDGKLLFSEKRMKSNSTFIDISFLQLGFYILKTELNNGHCETFKFIKQ